MKTTLTYKLLYFIGLHYSAEEYGTVSILDVVRKVYKTYRNEFLLKYCMNIVLLSPLNPLKVRPFILKLIGCSIGKNIFIGKDVFIDSGHADLIRIDDRAHVTARTVLLCHKRNLSNYYADDDYAQLPYLTAPIHLKEGCSTGTDSIIMPGVTIGKGSIIGAGSLVTKDIPDWCVAVGRPAKVIKKIPQRN
ncbi:acyltransferase [Bacteroides fragilis]|uniref:acyltransferase n=1 Tax=Bacteroides hominis TaxID=2763023 RepID=UPI0029415755|nr:acyltransferase [Bacteroides fragilis]